jgi:hypothetical protein
MASGHTGRMLTYFGSMGKGGAHAVDSLTELSRRTYRQPLNAKQKAESRARDKPKDSALSKAAAIGQWTCFVLGVVCTVCGAFGIFAQHIEGPPPSASVAWLGSAYMPTLRVTALLCLSMGLVLVRRGWSSPDREQKGAKVRDDPEDIPMVYLLYVVLGIFLLVVGAAIFIVRMFLAFQSPSMLGK